MHFVQCHCGNSISFFDAIEIDRKYYCEDCQHVAIKKQAVESSIEQVKAQPAPFSGPEPGSHDRYERRKEKQPWLSHTAWWLVHNIVAHPLIGVLPVRPFFEFHDWTSRKMHGV